MEESVEPNGWENKVMMMMMSKGGSLGVVLKGQSMNMVCEKGGK